MISQFAWLHRTLLDKKVVWSLPLSGSLSRLACCQVNKELPSSVPASRSFRMLPIGEKSKQVETLE